MGFVWGDPVGSVVVGEDEAFGCQVGLGGAAKSGQLDGGELIHVHGGGDLLTDHDDTKWVTSTEAAQLTWAPVDIPAVEAIASSHS